MANTFKMAQAAVSTSATTLYTCPAATTAVIHALFLANVDGAASVNATVEVTDTSAGVTRKLGYLLPVPAASTLIFDKPINLEATDVLKITASASGDLEAYASVLEIT